MSSRATTWIRFKLQGREPDRVALSSKLPELCDLVAMEDEQKATPSIPAKNAIQGLGTSINAH